jgi:methylglyoxal synthase
VEIAITAHYGKKAHMVQFIIKNKAIFKMLIRICDLHNVPLATNEATAQLLLNALAVD